MVTHEVLLEVMFQYLQYYTENMDKAANSCWWWPVQVLTTQTWSTFLVLRLVLCWERTLTFHGCGFLKLLEQSFGLFHLWHFEVDFSLCDEPLNHCIQYLKSCRNLRMYEFSYTIMSFHLIPFHSLFRHVTMCIHLMWCLCIIHKH